MFPLISAFRGRQSAALASSVAIVATLSFFLLVSGASADSDILAFGSSSTPAVDAPSCRYGAATMAPSQISWQQQLNVGWYVNFSPQGYPGATAAEFVPVIRVLQQRDGCTRLPGYTTNPPLTDAGLGAAVRSRLGALWIVGNEVDRGPNPEDTTCANRAQDDTAPEVYARAYFDVYHYIKQIDPTAKIANAALVEVTPGRLQYLDIAWNTYRAVYGVDMPVDVWNMHLYILPEALSDGRPNGIANIAIGTDPALAIRESGGQASMCARADVYCWGEHDDINEFAGQVVAMRQWMKDHGQREKPLIISEYSLLYPYLYDPTDPTSCFKDEYGNCFTPARVTNFLNQSLDYLENAKSPELGYSRDENRLVQRWLWFSVDTDTVGYVSDLVDTAAAQLTQAGIAFSSRTAAAPRNVNLFPATAYGANAGAGTNSVLLTTEVRNQGTVPTGQSFVVNFYADAGLTNLIGSVTVPAALAGCGSSAYAQQAWSGLSPGLHSFWVKVDADGVLPETQETDNVMEGKVLVPSSRLWLPTLLRGASFR